MSHEETAHRPFLRELGSTGIKIAPLGFGAGQLSIGEYTDRAQSIAVLNEAMDRYDMVDTADSYCLDASDTGHNELLIAEVWKKHPRRDKVLIATKGGLIRRDLYTVDIDISAERLRRTVEESRERLGLPSLGLYYLHAPSLQQTKEHSAFEEAIETLGELRDEGKIQHIGISNVTLEQIALAHRLVPITAVQNRLSFLDREDLENGVVDYCTSHQISYIPYSPLRGRDRHSSIAHNPALAVYAKEKKIDSPYQAALFWLLDQAPNIIPIPAARKMEHLLGSAEVLKIWERGF
jgi:aryl-alcohol dehydrogenase-like predicted oxidoreductase